ncbi:MAG: CvpA family protein [Patescibacteria group bacterium]
MQLLNGNYIDLIIIAILIYFASEAFRHGFWVILADFISFFGSLVLSLRFYSPISQFLKLNFDLNLSVSKAIGFLIASILFESVLGYTFGYLIHKLPDKIKRHKFNHLLGLIPGIGEGLVLVSALLILIIALPIKPQIKSDITESEIGSVLLSKTAVFETAINEVFGGVINESLTYFTVNPDSGESVSLDVDSFKLSVDEKAESDMFAKINQERKKLAIPELILLAPLSGVARNHAKNMWERKYFAHVSPEGKDVGDRLQESKVNYSFAGENLALAPTTITAHTGLMNSKGHRENILDPRFKKVGVGVIDNGIYGKMYVQVFSD